MITYKKTNQTKRINLGDSVSVTIIKSYGQFGTVRPNRANQYSGIPKGRADLKLRKF